MTAKQFLEEKQSEHFKQFGVYADTNSKIAEWMESYSLFSVFTRQKVTRDIIIEFQDALIQVMETHKDGDLKSQLFIDSYKSTIEELKEQLNSKT